MKVLPLPLLQFQLNEKKEKADYLSTSTSFLVWSRRAFINETDRLSTKYCITSKKNFHSFSLKFLNQPFFIKTKLYLIIFYRKALSSLDFKRLSWKNDERLFQFKKNIFFTKGWPHPWTFFVMETHFMTWGKKRAKKKIGGNKAINSLTWHFFFNRIQRRYQLSLCRFSAQIISFFIKLPSGTIVQGSGLSCITETLQPFLFSETLHGWDDRANHWKACLVLTMVGRL